MNKTAQSVRHPVFARLYTRISAAGEKRGAAAHRRELLAGLSGRVIELGAGDGANFAHYPATVSEVVAVEPESYLRQRAIEAASRAPVRVTVLDGVADRLPLEDASIDAGVASLVLCSVPDQGAALAELSRVIRSGGELRYYEHVVSTKPGFARFQRAIDRLVWPRIAGGCHASRDTGRSIEHAGFVVEKNRRFPFSPSPVLPGIPHILGIARRP